MKVSISTVSILKVAGICLLIYFLFLIKEVLAILFVSLILASAFDPWVDFMNRYKIPRGIGILLIYLIMFGLLGGVIYLLIPLIYAEFAEISKSFPAYYDKIYSSLSNIKDYSLEHGFITNESFSGFLQKTSPTAGGFFGAIAGFFGGIISFFVILVVTFYMTIEETALKRCFRFLVPDKYQPFTTQLTNKMQRKIGSWFQGQLILCLIVGILVYIGLSILGVRYALILALLAAVCEIIPYVGPIIGAIPAIFLTIMVSPVKGIMVAVLYLVIQQLENHVLVPKVMQKAVGLNPIISISALLIGAKINGVTGALLAIPVATAVSVLIKEFFKEKEIEEKNDELTV